MDDPSESNVPKGYSTVQDALIASATRTLDRIGDQTSEDDMAASVRVMLLELTTLASKWMYLGICIAQQQPDLAAMLWRVETQRSPDFIAATTKLVSQMRTAGDA